MNARNQHRTGVLVISAVAVLIAVALFATAAWRMISFYRSFTQAGAGTQDAPASAPASTEPLIASSIEDYYGQQIQWRPCTESEVTPDVLEPPADMAPYQCATVTAPLDWNDPAGEQIQLAVAVHRNGAEDAPALFYNLGGPGGNAVKSLSYQVGDSLGAALLDAYDIVAVDPRGVGASTPVKCMNDEELDDYNTGEEHVDTDMTAAETIAEYQETTREIAEGCQKYTGDLFKHVDTVSAAKDFDMMRALLGQERLNYLGYSYGTFLGATYADLFPGNVGRMVLDGAIDPSLTVNEISDLQMKGFDESVRHWVEDCQAGSKCPLTGTVDDGVATLRAFLERLGQQPLPTADPERPLTQNLALTAVVGMMYSTDNYSLLTQAMSQALGDNDGSQMLVLADYLNDRNQDGSYSSNGTDALMAINNLDYEPAGTPEQWEADAARLRSELDVMGLFAGYSSAGLDQWPTTHAVRAPIRAEGAASPIVVVGTTHDPATPYVMAQSLASQLATGVLVTSEGWDHTAYSKSASECVVGAVEGYLVDGTAPQDGLSCK